MSLASLLVGANNPNRTDSPDGPFVCASAAQMHAVAIPTAPIFVIVEIFIVDLQDVWGN
jgi:hypothetical protein